ncbi:MAG: tetratricopeptide repeat protein [Candidatus Kapabacteria bacterium]|nr:tetratricopeptide repeat protein [Candidatus Kapabacteria bacterium]
MYAIKLPRGTSSMQMKRLAIPYLLRSSVVSITMLVSLFCWVECRAQTDDRSAQIRKAREYFINGTTLQIQGNRHADAILEFQQALRYDSSSATFAAIARSYLELRKLDMASEWAEMAINRDSSSRDTWELIAEIEVMRGQYDAGIAAYERILTRNPTHRQLYTLGRLYEPRNAAKAIVIFERLCESQPDETVLLRLADLYERLRDIKGVLRALERARALDPIDPQIASRTCELYVHEGMFPELQVLLSSWRGRDLDLDRSARVWGVTLSSILEDTLVLGVYRDQIAIILDDAKEYFPQVWPVMALAGTVSMRLDDTTRAAVFFDLTIKSPESRPESFLEIARIYLLHNHPQEAERYLLLGQRRFPIDARFPFLLGGSSLDLGKDAQAADYYRYALSLDSTIVDAWVQLGLLYDQRGLIDSSDLAYEHALLMDADHALANNNYGYSLAGRGIHLDRARTMGWKAVQAEPMNPAYLDTYAWILYRSEEYEKARTYLERAITIGANATHFEHYGDVLEALGDIDGALRAWKNSLLKDPQRTSIQMKIDKYR